MPSTPPPSQEPDKGSHAAALWSLFWRATLLLPIVVIVGSLALTLVALLSYLPLFIPLLLLLGYHYLWAPVLLVIWWVWLRYGGPVRTAVFAGFEHASL